MKLTRSVPAHGMAAIYFFKNNSINLKHMKETVSAGEPLNGEVIAKWKTAMEQL